MAAPKIRSLDHLVLTVRDLQATLQFYCDTLGMEHISFATADGSHRHALGFGNQKINLHIAGREFEPKADAATPGSADLCFLVSPPLNDWADRLTERETAIEHGPVTRTGATGPIASLYVRDPDRNLIELGVPI